MFGSWKIYGVLGLLLLLATGAALYFRKDAENERNLRHAAEEKLARAEAIIAFKDAQMKVVNHAVAVKDAADKKAAKQIDTLQKELAHDPQANDPAPRVIRRALGKLSE